MKHLLNLFDHHMKTVVIPTFSGAKIGFFEI